MVVRRHRARGESMVRLRMLLVRERRGAAPRELWNTTPKGFAVEQRGGFYFVASTIGRDFSTHRLAGPHGEEWEAIRAAHFMAVQYLGDE